MLDRWGTQFRCPYCNVSLLLWPTTRSLSRSFDVTKPDQMVDQLPPSERCWVDRALALRSASIIMLEKKHGESALMKLANAFYSRSDLRARNRLAGWLHLQPISGAGRLFPPLFIHRVMDAPVILRATVAQQVCRQMTAMGSPLDTSFRVRRAWRDALRLRGHRTADTARRTRSAV